VPKIFECEVPDLSKVILRDPEPQTVDWQGRKALRLSGQGPSLLIIPDLSLSQGQIEVDISSEGTAYPGIAFRILDTLNYELEYAQPHTSGMWDALQYDPVFHGSNTWQLYHGSGAQLEADVPEKEWFRLRVGFLDQRAMIRIGEQEPLLVNILAHPHQSGLVGLWTFLPAYFSNMVVWDDPSEFPTDANMNAIETSDPGMVAEWFLDGYGRVAVEPKGILNLNRFLPSSVDEAELIRSIEMPADGNLTFRVGFSDDLVLLVDEDVIFSGENLYQSSPHWEERGYVSLQQDQVNHHLTKGGHQIKAILKKKESFGFGITLSVEGDKHHLLPIATISWILSTSWLIVTG
jgi:hypothetical protein